MPPLDDFRKKYPQYNDIPDGPLMEKLHAKHYSDMPIEKFTEKMTGKSATPHVPMSGVEDPNHLQPITEDDIGTPHSHSRFVEGLKETWKEPLGMSDETMSQLPRVLQGGGTKALTKVADFGARVASSLGVSAAVGDLTQAATGDETAGDLAQRDAYGLIQSAQIAAGMAPEAAVPEVTGGSRVSSMQPLKNKLDDAIGGWFDRDPEAAKIALNLAKEGRPVSPGGYLRSSKRLQFGIELARKFGYDPTAAAESGLATDRVKEMLSRAGMHPDEIEDTLQQMKEPGDTGFQKSGEALQGQLEKDRSETDAGVQKQADKIRSGATAAGTQAETELQNNQTELQRQIAAHEGKADVAIAGNAAKTGNLNQPPGDLGEDVSGAIDTQLAKEKKSLSDSYAKVDALTKGAKTTVDTRGLNSALADFRADMPEELLKNNPALNRTLKSVEEGDVSFSELHALRSHLRDLANYDRLAPSLRNGQVKYLAKLVDHAMSLKNRSVAKDANLNAASKLLRETDARYAATMAKYKDIGLQRLANNMKSGMSPDPGKIARQIASGDNSALRRQILQIANKSKGLPQRIRAAHWQDMIGHATNPITGDVNTKQFFDAVSDAKRSGVLGDLYGSSAGNIETLARRMAQRSGEIGLDKGPQDNFVRSLSAAAQKQEQLKQLAKTKPGELFDRAMKEGEARIADLRKRRDQSDAIDPLHGLRSKEADAASRELLAKPNLLEHVIERHGADSNAVKLLRQDAAQHILSPVLQGKGAEALESTLGALPRKTRQLLFPDGLGEDLSRIAKELTVMHGQPTEAMAGMGAGAKLGGGLKAYAMQAVAKVLMSSTITNPRMVKLLAGGLREGGAAAVNAKSQLIRLAASSAARGGEAAGTDQQPTQHKPGNWRDLVPTEHKGKRDWRKLAG